MFSKLSLKIRQLASLELCCITLAIYLVCYAVFFYADVPFGLQRMRHYAGELAIMDERFYYTPTQAHQLLDGLGATGRAIYWQILTADMVYPAILGTFLTLTIALILKHTVPAKSRLHLLNLLPLANTLFDYGENVMTFSQLANYPTQLNVMAAVGGFLTMAKNLFGLFSFSAVLIGLGVLCFQYVSRKWRAMASSTFH